ncbi:hypothetical protein EDD90_3258 [Streptomyces sp. Ag109_O5-1]|uniref:hypothetical protein n=1 Tax=Streptomyces sp. Ag109_O5-1 TaxID=1938851 RepID=UPI000F508CC7|nr:hypothetical protein [Streptomyces sp. Ag109_O5-1]RPE40222.1 hypothetical protein EDD90_3258 [Streptomyces sp. Ag109_O5-1]
MIEITIRLNTPDSARRFAGHLRALAATEAHRGQARQFRGTARRLEQLTRPVLHYAPRVRRPAHPGIDEGAVQRVVAGHQPFPVLSRDEARLACWHLTQRACPAPEIAARIRVAQRTVHRWRAEDRQAVTA